METSTKRLHPLLTMAAISLTLLSAVGVAALTGLIPHSTGSVSEPTPVTAAPTPTTEPAPAPLPAKRHAAKSHPAPKVAAAELPGMTPPPPPLAQVKPGLFGTVVDVREVEQQGEANGVGAVGGGLAGAVLGHNISDHNKLVTVLGAAGGALLGNQIEKQARATKHWEMTVRFDDGTSKTMTSEAQPFWHQGDRVRFYEGKLQPV